MAICAFSHYIVIQVLEEQLTSQVFVKFIETHIIQKYGPCQYLVSDQDAVLKSGLVFEACEKLGITRLFSQAYSPKSNLSELANRILLDTLRSGLQNHCVHKENVLVILTHTIVLINSLNFQNSRQLSPFSLMFGREAGVVLPNLLTPQNMKNISKLQYFNQVKKLLKMSCALYATEHTCREHTRSQQTGA